jgi:hypothetical protein
MNLRKWVGAAALAVLFVSATVVKGSLITGTLNFTGSLNLAIDGEDFLPAGGGSGQVQIQSSAGEFAMLEGTSATILDMTRAVEPIDTAISIPDFLDPAAAPNITFSLDFIDPGVFGSSELTSPPAVGQTATPTTELGPSHLDMVNVSGGCTVSFSLSGIEVDTLTGATAPFDGIFTMQFAYPYQTLMADLASGDPQNTSFSASFTVAPVPEPASVFLLAACLLAIGLRRPRRQPFLFPPTRANRYSTIGNLAEPDISGCRSPI